MRDLRDYREIQAAKRRGKTKYGTATELRICRSTVQKLWHMDEETFTKQFYGIRKIELLEKRMRDVMLYLNQNRNASARKVHEHLAQTGTGACWSGRTTARFVQGLRERYGVRK